MTSKSDVGVRDLIYFDADKAASLHSQLTGGLITMRQRRAGSETESRNIRRYNLRFFRPEFGGREIKRESELETRKPHHERLRELESALLREGEMLLDLDSAFEEPPNSAVAIRDRLADYDYLRASGWTVFEDYGRMSQVLLRFNALVQFIQLCSVHSELQEAQDEGAIERFHETLDQIEEQAEEADDPNVRARYEVLLRQTREDIEALIEDALEAEEDDQIPEWLSEGLRFWIDTYSQDRIALRLFPVEAVPEFQVVANLKREWFVGGGADDIRAAYGGKPNLPLTVFGLVTSLPPESPPRFDRLADFGEEGIDTDALDEEKALGAMFRRAHLRLLDMERFSRSDHYPNVQLHPIAVFRDIERPGAPLSATPAQAQRTCSPINWLVQKTFNLL